jgi:hypothetical protein
MAKRLLHRYTFIPGNDTVILKGNYQRDRLLLITNTEDNIIIYNFADPNLTAISVTFDADTEETTIVLNYNCAFMSETDTLQIFVEEDAVRFKPDQSFIDPVSKFRISEAQTLIDTDFEYGLQSTKWETLELVNNIPGFYSKTGDTPLNVTNISGTPGARTLIISAPSHGQTVGTPLDIRGLDQPNLEGSYVITRVPDADTIVVEGKNVITTSASLNGPYTNILAGRFYAGSQINYSNIVGLGTSITVSTDYPSGFKSGSEFYLINTVGTETVSFASSLADPQDTNIVSQTFDPNENFNINESNTLTVDPWNFVGVLNSRFIRAGNSGQIAANTINSDAHGLTNGQCVAVLTGPNSTLPTGLVNRTRYFVVNAATNSFQLSLTSGGAAVAITANTGTGIFVIFEGYGITAINTTANTVTITKNNSQVATSTPLFLVATTATGGTSSPAFSVSTQASLYDTTATGNLYYFRTVNTTLPTLAVTPGGAAINFTSTGVLGTPILAPIVSNPDANTINIVDHEFIQNDPISGIALTFRYSTGGGTAIGGLVDNGVYFLDPVNANKFGLKTTSAGSRINLTNYAATGTAHSLTTVEGRLTRNSLFVPSHGLTQGQQVVYGGVGSGTTIGGLVEDQTYFVLPAFTDSANRIRLSETIGSPEVDITSVGVGTHQLFLQTEGDLDGAYILDDINSDLEFTLENTAEISPTVRTFDPGIAVSTTSSTVEIINHRYVTGTPVIYSAGSGSPIGGLQDGQTYFTVRTSKDKFKLSLSLNDSQSGIVTSLTSVGIGSQHSLTSNSLAGEYIGIGSVSLTAGSNRVTGERTAFLSDFKIGDPFVVNIDSDTVFESEVASVGSNEKIVLAGAATTTDTGLDYLKKTALYIKSEAYALHRPYDGGVEINARKVADNQIIRQTRRYFRYQSGKGISAQFAINFNPPIDIQSLTSSGDVATISTRFRHEVSPGSTIIVRGAEVGSGVNYYNGTFTVASTPTETTLTYVMNGVPSDDSANGFPEMIVTNWGGSIMRAGMYDDQNGLFWEFNGTVLKAVRRDSVSQISGRINVQRNSNLVTGSDTRFGDQLSEGSRLVIRGQTYKVVKIESNTNLYIQPAYRGQTSTSVIPSKVIDEKVNQEDWSLDPCDGTGYSGYVLDKTRIQMVYIDYSWYGAGKARFGFKDQNGEVFYCHEFLHNNKKNQAYFRSGNLPARYEIENIGVPGFAPSLAHWGSTVQMDGKFEDDDAYLFTASSSLLSFSGNSVGVAVTTGNYTYVDQSGSVSSTLTTFDSRNFDSTRSLTTSSTGSGVNLTSNYIQFSTNHGYATGQLIQYFSGAGTPVGGLVNLNYYYVRVVSLNRIQLHLTEADAFNNVNRINLTSTGTGFHAIRSNFRFSVVPTTITGYGSRIIHRIQTDAATYDILKNISFGTPITSTAINARGGDISPKAYVYRVSQAASPSTAAVVDFFFASEPASLQFPNFPSLGETGFIPGATTAVDTFTIGEDNPVPSLIPLLSIRLSPSVDSGITGALGVREILNRMQLDLKKVGLLTTHDVDIRLVLNAQLDNNAWSSQGVPSLSQLIAHQNNDTITSGVQIFSFRASGGAEVTEGGRRSANTFSEDISQILSLGNSILGGDNTFPDGPDVLTLAIAPLNPSQITLASPLSISGRITWSESQA